MTRVSKYLLDSALEEEMFRQFWLSLSFLRDAGTVASFFTDLLTDAEEIMLAKRFTIAVLIMRGRKFSEIKDTIHVSDSTIGSVNAWLKNAKPRTREILRLIIKESRWQKLLDQIDVLLDKIPPRYGTNWSRVESDKRQRRMDRRSRSELL
ncbi:MAG TPA: Trp family transcriptional regulator [Patescibacteria group bacterium]|nr:Trp family transcriptional regulator [Patescibacteria group bacterium]